MRSVSFFSVVLLGVWGLIGCSARPQVLETGSATAVPATPQPPQSTPQATVAPSVTSVIPSSAMLAPTGVVTGTVPLTDVVRNLPVFGGNGNLPPGWQSANVSEIEWRDSSLGCPEPGKMYLQVIIPGYRVVLQKNGETIEIHTDKSGDHMVICKTPPQKSGNQLPDSAGTPEIQAPPSVLEAAKSALAKDRDLAAAEIQVASVEKQIWPDASLGCPQAGYVYAQALTPGYKVILKSGNTEYVYHTDEVGKQIVTCLPPSGALPAGKTVVVPAADMVSAARQDLSSRHKTSSESIQVMSVSTGEMALQGLGCGAEATVTVPTQVMGTLITLQVGGKLYEYRAHLKQLVFCGEKTN